MTQLNLDRLNAARLLQDTCKICSFINDEDCIFYKPSGIADWKKCAIGCPASWDLEKLEKEMNQS